MRASREPSLDAGRLMKETRLDPRVSTAYTGHSTQQPRSGRFGPSTRMLLAGSRPHRSVGTGAKKGAGSAGVPGYGVAQGASLDWVDIEVRIPAQPFLVTSPHSCSLSLLQQIILCNRSRVHEPPETLEPSR